MLSRHRYIERRVAIEVHPIALVTSLAGAGVRTTYTIYEREGEWSLALGSGCEIVADEHGVHLSIGAERHSWSGEDTLASVQQALGLAPFRGFRAYGTASFELAYRLLGIEAEHSAEPLLQLTIPSIEVRVRSGCAWVRAVDGLELEKICHLVEALGRSSHKVWDRYLSRASSGVDDLSALLRRPCDAAAYKALVAAATRDIAERKLDKVIVSRVVRLDTPFDLVGTYVKGRRGNSPARSFLVNRGDVKLVGFSPETVLEVSADGTVTTQPLAGTRALDPDERKSAELRRELLTDAKELAEHAMSVKLAFEELRQVCRHDSVRVVEFMSVSNRGSVQHLASRLSGSLSEGNTAWTAFKVLFPAVTASGIPKREAVDWIRRHEAEHRDLYSGAVLTVDEDGAMDAALILRTAFQRGNQVWLRAGAGVVTQSTPERELEETCEKLESVARYLVPLETAPVRCEPEDAVV